MNKRRYDIDWLRVFATYLLFPFHVGKVYDVPPYYPIKSPDLTPALNNFTSFVHLWHMPLFFVLAGWSLHASWSLRGERAVLRERVNRIFIPFLAGTVTLCVVVGYYERVMMPGQDLTFWQYLPKFFTSLDYFTWSQLWFLIYLFVFTLLWLPVFRRLLAKEGTLVLRHSWHIYRPIPVLILIQGLRIWWPGYQNLYNDWANFFYYSAMLMLGFVLGSQPAIAEAVQREWRRAAIVGPLAGVIAIWSLSHGPDSEMLRHIPYHVLSPVAGLCIIIGLLGFGREYLNRRNRSLDYLAESALPVYILHQAGIVVPGWYIVHMNLPLPVRVVMLLAVSVAVTMAVYHFLVRPFGITRRLTGMKALRSQTKCG